MDAERRRLAARNEEFAPFHSRGRIVEVQRTTDRLMLVMKEFKIVSSRNGDLRLDPIMFYYTENLTELDDRQEEDIRLLVEIDPEELRISCNGKLRVANVSHSLWPLIDPADGGQLGISGEGGGSEMIELEVMATRLP